MRSKVCTAQEAVGEIQDEDWITIGGTLGWSLPTAVLDALETRFLTESEPRDLTWFDPFPTGLPGIEPLAHSGLLKRVIGGWYTPHPAIRALILANKVEAYCYPLGSLAFWCQQIGAGRDGLLTPVGLNTYVDPRQRGGRLNAVARDELVAVVQVDGREYIWYRHVPITVAILRGTTVDTAGNLSFEEEHVTMSALHQALAAKRNGGTVIVQAKQLVDEGEIPPRQVTIPAPLVDRVVLHPDQHANELSPDLAWLDPGDRVPRPPRQVLTSMDHEVWRQWVQEGQRDVPETERELTADRLVGRRAVLEMRPGSVVNVGQGLPARDVIPAAIDEGVDQAVELSIETGNLGGIVNGLGFRSGMTAVLDTPSIFSMYATDVMDATFLSMLQFDANGSVNLLRYGDTWVGPGGSMDIAHHINRIVFVGTFTAGGLVVACHDGQLEILTEGMHARGVQRVEEICFNGSDLVAAGKEVTYVTERAVFELAESGPKLVEVAPGIDVQTEVLDVIRFRPTVADDLKSMDPRIFRPGPMGIFDAEAWLRTSDSER